MFGRRCNPNSSFPTNLGICLPAYPCPPVTMMNTTILDLAWIATYFLYIARLLLCFDDFRCSPRRRPPTTNRYLPSWVGEAKSADAFDIQSQIDPGRCFLRVYVCSYVLCQETYHTIPLARELSSLWYMYLLTAVPQSCLKISSVPPPAILRVASAQDDVDGRNLEFHLGHLWIVWLFSLPRDTRES